MKKETKVVCPVCGAEFEIGEHEHQVKNATIIGKDSGLGTIELPLVQKKTKAQQRIDQLKAKGIDTSKMYAMIGIGGKKKIGVTTKKGFAVVEVDDNIERIMRCGTINTSHLFKQHVLAQMLHGLVNRIYYTNSGSYVLETDKFGYPTLDNGYYGKRVWYDYSWNVVNDEMMRQAAMYRHGDTKSFDEDNRWYNKHLVMRMADDFSEQLIELIKSMRVHKCRGKKYIKYKGAEKLLSNKRSAKGYVYLDELDEMYKNLKKYKLNIYRSKNPIELHHAIEEFCKVRPTLFVPSGEIKKGCSFKPKVYSGWINAYKGYGAYFSMRNLIMFHDCKIYADNGEILNKQSSLDLLDIWADMHKDDAYWLIGALKQVLRTNNFDIEAKQREWAAKYK